ncbi:MAG: BrnT family toxin [Microvirga sp.]|jgi:uncharacterized protein
MRIVWDELKRLTNLRDHDFDFAELEGAFDFEAALIVPAHLSRFGGRRFKAIGLFGDDLVAVVFSRLGTEALSIISFRRASRSERRLYAES